MHNRAALAAWFIVGTAAALLAGCRDPAEGVQSADTREVVKSVEELARRGSDEDIERIYEVTTHNNSLVAAEAVRGLGSIRRPKAVEALSRVVAEEQRSDIREEAVLQLGRQKEDPPISILRQVIQADPDARVRAAAATSIAGLRSWDDAALLMDVAERDPDLVVQSRAVSAVEDMIGLKFGYDSRAPMAERQKALARMRSIALTAAATLRQYDSRAAGPR